MAWFIEAVRNILTRERTVQRWEQEMPVTGTSSFDVFMRKGTEYIVRGRIRGGNTPVEVSFEGPDGTSLQIRQEKGRVCFSIVPELDSLYRIKTHAKGVIPTGEPVTMSVSLAYSCAPPPYILRQSVIPEYLASHPELMHRLSDRETEREAGSGPAYPQSLAG